MLRQNLRMFKSDLRPDSDFPDPFCSGCGLSARHMRDNEPVARFRTGGARFPTIHRGEHHMKTTMLAVILALTEATLFAGEPPAKTSPAFDKLKALVV